MSNWRTEIRSMDVLRTDLACVFCVWGKVKQTPFHYSWRILIETTRECFIPESIYRPRFLSKQSRQETSLWKVNAKLSSDLLRHTTHLSSKPGPLERPFSRLYRRRIWQSKHHLQALAKIYSMHTFFVTLLWSSQNSRTLSRKRAVVRL